MDFFGYPVAAQRIPETMQIQFAVAKIAWDLERCGDLIDGDIFLSIHSFFSSQSFWKTGSARSGSQNGSSLRRAGVMGVVQIYEL